MAIRTLSVLAVLVAVSTVVLGAEVNLPGLGNIGQLPVEANPVHLDIGGLKVQIGRIPNKNEGHVFQDLYGFSEEPVVIISPSITASAGQPCVAEWEIDSVTPKGFELTLSPLCPPFGAGYMQVTYYAIGV